MKKEQAAQEILMELIQYDNPDNIQSNLREMMDAYFLYHDDLTPEEKHNIYGCYKMFSELIEKVKRIEPQLNVNRLPNN